MAVSLLQVAGAFVEAIADGHTNIVNQVRASPLTRAFIQMTFRLSHMPCLRPKTMLVQPAPQNHF